GERAVGDERLAAADADRLRPARRRELVSDQPLATLSELVDPPEALVGRRLGRLLLRVHALGGPADQQQVLHGSLPSSVSPGRRAGARPLATFAQPENSSASACAMTSSGVGGDNSISTVCSTSGSPACR